MTLPAYAEELERLIINKTSHHVVGLHVTRYLDRILRDAEIAEAAREYARVYKEQWGYNAETLKVRDALFDLIAKETP